MGGVIMKQFNVKEYLENPSRQVVTRNGLTVRIICTDAKDTFPVIGLVKNHDGTECTHIFKKNGNHSGYYRMQSPFDLFFAPIKCEGWVNIYKSTNAVVNKRTGYVIFDTKEEALEVVKSKAQAMYQDQYLDTVKIEWEEE